MSPQREDSRGAGAGCATARDERLLVLRAGALGDFVLTLPALRTLRKAFPRAAIELAGYEATAALAQAEGLVDRVSRVDDPLLAPLSSGRVSAALKDFLAPFARAVCIWRDPERRIASALERAGVPAVHCVEPIPPEGSGTHCVDYMLSQLPADWPRAAAEPKVTPDASLRRRAAERLRALAGGRTKSGTGVSPVSRSGGVAGVPPATRGLEARATTTAIAGERAVIVHPGSGGRGEDRNWPPERFAEVVERLRSDGRAVALLRGPADEEAVERTLAAIGASSPPILDGLDVCGLAALLSVCAGCVGNDSGVSHLAAAVGAPTVAVFGATDPALWAPRGPRVRVLRPGLLPDGRRAPIGSIAGDDVLSALECIAGEKEPG